jgi:hypothetical protein
VKGVVHRTVTHDIVGDTQIAFCLLFNWVSNNDAHCSLLIDWVSTSPGRVRP